MDVDGVLPAAPTVVIESCVRLQGFNLPRAARKGINYLTDEDGQVTGVLRSFAAQRTNNTLQHFDKHHSCEDSARSWRRTLL